MTQTETENFSRMKIACGEKQQNLTSLPDTMGDCPRPQSYMQQNIFE